jgi:hypothetical protein
MNNEESFMKRSVKKNSPADHHVRDPWLPLLCVRGKRSAKESEVQYTAFEIYYTMGPAERSLRRVAERVGKSESWIENWSSSFRWSRRAAAWDRQQARRLAVEFEEQQKQAIRIEVQQLAREREDREQKCLQRKDQTRKDLFAAAKSMLDLPLATLTVKEEVRRCPGTEQAAHGPEPAIPCVTAKSFLAARYPLKRPPLRDLFPPQVEA